MCLIRRLARHCTLICPKALLVMMMQAQEWRRDALVPCGEPVHQLHNLITGQPQLSLPAPTQSVWTHQQWANNTILKAKTDRVHFIVVSKEPRELITQCMEFMLTLIHRRNRSLDPTDYLIEVEVLHMTVDKGVYFELFYSSRLSTAQWFRAAPTNVIKHGLGLPVFSALVYASRKSLELGDTARVAVLFDEQPCSTPLLLRSYVYELWSPYMLFAAAQMVQRHFLKTLVCDDDDIEPRPDNVHGLKDVIHHTLCDKDYIHAVLQHTGPGMHAKYNMDKVRQYIAISVDMRQDIQNLLMRRGVAALHTDHHIKITSAAKLSDAQFHLRMNQFIRQELVQAFYAGDFEVSQETVQRWLPPVLRERCDSTCLTLLSHKLVSSLMSE
jgi:hypothetical protein